MADNEGATDQEQESGSGANESSPEGAMGLLSALLSQLNFQRGSETGSTEREERPPQVLETLDIEGVAKYIKDGKAQNIVIMTGAGISTCSGSELETRSPRTRPWMDTNIAFSFQQVSKGLQAAGIPDFRSPSSGLYDNLQKYNLPSPQSMFEIGFFMSCPEPFYSLAKELYPGKFKPTPCHYFMKLLNDKGFLLRHFTQNIDTLDRIAGLPGEKIVEAHGSFHISHCLGDCKREYSEQWMKKKIFQEEVEVVRCEDCGGLVKPDIVFFGEAMPEYFYPRVTEDLPKCDLAIVMGSSLLVQPFASLIDRVPKDCPRLLINMEKSGQADPFMQMLGIGRGMEFDSEENYRDVAWIGTCDDGCSELARLLGWKEELDQLIQHGHSKLQAEKEDFNRSSQEGARDVAGEELQPKEQGAGGQRSPTEAKEDVDKEQPMEMQKNVGQRSPVEDKDATDKEQPPGKQDVAGQESIIEAKESTDKEQLPDLDGIKKEE